MRNLILLAVLPFLLCGCSSLRNPEPSIRTTLLKKTPLDSSYQDVWHYAERKGWHPVSQKPQVRRAGAGWELGIEIEGHTFWMESGADSQQFNPEQIGTRWIHARLGRYWHRNGWYEKGISCYYVVDAYWCFDAKDKLTDILVFKETEPPPP